MMKRINREGTIVNGWKIGKYTGRKYHNHGLWKAKCPICGKIKEITPSAMSVAHSCGCDRYYSGRSKKNREGEIINGWKIGKEAGTRTKGGEVEWEVECPKCHKIVVRPVSRMKAQSACGCQMWLPFSDDHKLKISKALTGRIRSNEHKANISKAKIGKSTNAKGKPKSEKQRQCLREAALKYRREHGHPMEGKRHSEKTKKKLSEKSKSRAEAGIPNPFLGKKHTKESLEKMLKTKTQLYNEKLTSKFIELMLRATQVSEELEKKTVVDKV
jgi:NUMOD3 motif